MHVLVLGTGGVGGLYAARLAKAGAIVSVCCRSDYDAVKERGITVSSADHPDEDYSFRPNKVLRHGVKKEKEEELLEGYYDVPDILLVALKVFPEAVNVPELIAPLVGPNTAIALFQNGVEIEEPIANAFPDNELISVIVMVGVSRPKPGHVKHLGGGRLILGTYPRGVGEKTTALTEILRDGGGVECSVSETIAINRWKKVMWNGSFNPLSVLAGGASTGELLADPVSEDNIRKVMLEVWSVAKAVGCGFEQKVIDGLMESSQKYNSNYKTSMLLDFENHRPMEVEAILGNIVRAAERSGVEVPRISAMYASLRILDRKNQEKKNDA
jgi:2-dehydropantoate 2-reductase